MGWTRYLLLGDLGQQLDIADQEARISRLATRHQRRGLELEARLADLEQEVLQLGAGVAALVGLLRAKGVATDAEVAAALERATRQAEEAYAVRVETKAARDEAATKAAAARKLDRVRRRR
jgi:hypothetical protein